MLPLEKRLFALGERHLHAANDDVRNLPYAFFVHNQHFFTFVHEASVEPTNNSAERALRTAVERLLTIVRTCQLQHRTALVYFTAAIVAHRRRQAVASLLRRAQTA